MNPKIFAFYSPFMREVQGSVIRYTLATGETVDATEVACLLDPGDYAGASDSVFVADVSSLPGQVIVIDPPIFELFKKTQRTVTTRDEVLDYAVRGKTMRFLLDISVKPRTAMICGFGTTHRGN
jgi:hypothetical protein